MASHEQYPSLDVALDLVRERVAGQREQVDALDSKANFVLTSATVLVGTALTAQVAIAQTTLNIFGLSVSRALPLAVLIIPFLVVIYMTFQAYKIRSYFLAPEPPALVKYYLDSPAKVTKEDAVRAMAKAFGDNLPQIEEKVAWTRRALWALGAEAIVLVVVLILESLG